MSDYFGAKEAFESLMNGCRFGIHRWRGGRRQNTNPEPFSIEPVVGTRICARCGKRQRYFYDSQGGSWSTLR